MYKFNLTVLKALTLNFIIFVLSNLTFLINNQLLLFYCFFVTSVASAYLNHLNYYNQNDNANSNYFKYKYDYSKNTSISARTLSGCRIRISCQFSWCSNIGARVWRSSCNFTTRSGSWCSGTCIRVTRSSSSCRTWNNRSINRSITNLRNSNSWGTNSRSTISRSSSRRCSRSYSSINSRDFTRLREYLWYCRFWYTTLSHSYVLIIQLPIIPKFACGKRESAYWTVV